MHRLKKVRRYFAASPDLFRIYNYSFQAQKSPYAHEVLHKQARSRYARPAAGAEDKRLAAGLYELHDIGVYADSAHRKHNKKLAELLNRAEHRRVRAEAHGHGGYDRRAYEIEDKKREYLLEADLFPVRAVCLPRADKRQHERYGDDGQRPRQLDGHCLVQRLRAETPHRVPGACRRSDGGGVVHRRAGEYAEGFARGSVEADKASEGGEYQRRQHVEEEYDGDRLRNLLVAGVDDRCRGRYCRAAADGRAHAYERRYL